MMNKKTMDMRKATKDQELRKLALLSERELMMELRTSEKGLSNEDAEKRLEEFGPNEVSAQKPTPAIILFLSAFKDPFVYVLALLMVVSTLTKDFEAAIVMGVMILASVLIAFIQEYRSQKASLDLKEYRCSDTGRNYERNSNGRNCSRRHCNFSYRRHDSCRCRVDLDQRFIR